MKLTPNDLLQSRLSDRKSLPFPVAVEDDLVFTGPEVSLAKVTAESPGSWCITLGRLERVDQLPALARGDLAQSIPVFTSQNYAYSAGTQFSPAAPPRRSHPVWGAQVNGHNSTAQAFVEIAWGMGAAQPNRILATWPAQGASIVVSGNYVEVWGAGGVINPGGLGPVPTADQLPVFQAQVVPAINAPVDGANELSLTQTVPVFPLVIADAYSLDGVAVPAAGMSVTTLSPTVVHAHSALRGSAVKTTAPFFGYDATLFVAIGGTQPVPLSIAVVDFDGPGPSGVFLQDNAVINELGEFSFQLGAVAILIDTGAGGLPGTGPTFGELDAALATSSLLLVDAPSTNPAFFIASTTNPVVQSAWSAVAGYSPALAASGVVGAATILAPTQGGAVYVPDFARRVLVNLVVATDDSGEIGGPRVPLAGPRPVQLVWYNDQGDVIDAAMQGMTENPVSLAPLAVVPPTWLLVPAGAVMLGIYGATDVQQLATVHWRIAP